MPRSVLIKCDTDADSEPKEYDGGKKSMRWKGVALVFLWKGFIPVPQTTSARLKCLAL